MGLPSPPSSSQAGRMLSTSPDAILYEPPRTRSRKNKTRSTSKRKREVYATDSDIEAALKRDDRGEDVEAPEGWSSERNDVTYTMENDAARHSCVLSLNTDIGELDDTETVVEIVHRNLVGLIDASPVGLYPDKAFWESCNQKITKQMGRKMFSDGPTLKKRITARYYPWHGVDMMRTQRQATGSKKHELRREWTLFRNLRDFDICLAKLSGLVINVFGRETLMQALPGVCETDNPEMDLMPFIMRPEIWKAMQNYRVTLKQLSQRTWSSLPSRHESLGVSLQDEPADTQEAGSLVQKKPNWYHKMIVDQRAILSGAHSDTAQVASDLPVIQRKAPETSYGDSQNGPDDNRFTNECEYTSGSHSIETGRLSCEQKERRTTELPTVAPTFRFSPSGQDWDESGTRSTPRFEKSVSLGAIPAITPPRTLRSLCGSSTRELSELHDMVESERDKGHFEMKTDQPKPLSRVRSDLESDVDENVDVQFSTKHFTANNHSELSSSHSLTNYNHESPSDPKAGLPELQTNRQDSPRSKGKTCAAVYPFDDPTLLHDSNTEAVSPAKEHTHDSSNIKPSRPCGSFAARLSRSAIAPKFLGKHTKFVDESLTGLQPMYGRVMETNSQLPISVGFDSMMNGMDHNENYGSPQRKQQRWKGKEKAQNFGQAAATEEYLGVQGVGTPRFSLNQTSVQDARKHSNMHISKRYSPQSNKQVGHTISSTPGPSGSHRRGGLLVSSIENEDNALNNHPERESHNIDVRYENRAHPGLRTPSRPQPIAGHRVFQASSNLSRGLRHIPGQVRRPRRARKWPAGGQTPFSVSSKASGGLFVGQSSRDTGRALGTPFSMNRQARSNTVATEAITAQSPVTQTLVMLDKYQRVKGRVDESEKARKEELREMKTRMEKLEKVVQNLAGFDS